MLETAREKTAQGADPQDILQKENKRRARGTRQDVMVGIGDFEERTVYPSRKHPQVGYIFYEGKKQRVCIGFWEDEPVWKRVDDDDKEYTYCLQKTMRIEDDPDYCGGEGEEGTAELKNEEFFA